MSGGGEEGGAPRSAERAARAAKARGRPPSKEKLPEARKKMVKRITTVTPGNEVEDELTSSAELLAFSEGSGKIRMVQGGVHNLEGVVI